MTGLFFAPRASPGRGGGGSKVVCTGSGWQYGSKNYETVEAVWKWLVNSKAVRVHFKRREGRAPAAKRYWCVH